MHLLVSGRNARLANGPDQVISGLARAWPNNENGILCCIGELQRDQLANQFLIHIYQFKTSGKIFRTQQFLHQRVQHFFMLSNCKKILIHTFAKSNSLNAVLRG